jgi:hypothetical protein
MSYHLADLKQIKIYNEDPEKWDNTELNVCINILENVLNDLRGIQYKR